MLYPGAATSNPVDMLATGNADQLRTVLEYCEHEVDQIDSIVVIFGSPGLGSVKAPYEVIHKMIASCKKPIFAIMPSVVNVKNEIKSFIEKGNTAFYDEYLFGTCLARIAAVDFTDYRRALVEKGRLNTIQGLIESQIKGFLSPKVCFEILSEIGIPVVSQRIVTSKSELEECCDHVSFPVAQKVIGPLHKTDQKGVILNVNSKQDLVENYTSLMKIELLKVY